MMGNNYVRGAARIMACEEVIGDIIENLGDIIVLDEEERKYEPRPGIYDLGCSKTGVQIIQDGITEGIVKVSIAERHPAQIIDLWTHPEHPLTTLILATRRATGAIRTFVFDHVMMLPMEMDVPWRGEAMCTPVSWRYRGGRIMEQILLDD
jgi:hypothetical protein